MKAILKRIVRPFFRLAGPQARLDPDTRTTFPITYWYEPNLCEPSVQLALRDLISPGETVFDIGANCGSLSLLMSRLVGPKGVVCSFEASRRIVDKTQYNLMSNGCGNATVYHRAVFHTSRMTLPIYYGSHLNDSVLAANNHGHGFDNVETVALDDFTKTRKLTPSLMKLDIEGAEYDALQGGKDVIAREHPHLILEQQTDDSRCYEMLRSQGYIAIDLSTYQILKTYAGFPAGTTLTNIAYIHRDRIAATPFRGSMQLTKNIDLKIIAFNRDPCGTLNLATPIELPAGRYVFHFDHHAEGTKNEVMLGVEADGKPIARFRAYSKLLAENYQWMPLHLSRKTNINVFYRFLNRTSDSSFALRKIGIHRVEGFADTWNDFA